jgi:hypothetical protein
MSSSSSRLACRGRAVALVSSALIIVAVSLAASGAAQAATLPTITLALTKTTVTVGGTLQSGGVNVVSTTTGTKEASPVLFLLKPGVSAPEFDSYLDTNKASKDPNTAAKFGTIVFDAEAVPGATNEAQTTLQPGQYVAFSAEGEKSSTWPRANFAVATAASPAVLPTPQATIRSIEFGFRGPSVLHVGELVRFENEGFLVHMDVAFPAKSKSAAKKVVKGLLTGHEKGLEKLAAGPPFSFAGPLSGGAYQQETITAKPGWYVQACFMQTQDGRVHTLLGMERIIRIVK